MSINSEEVHGVPTLNQTVSTLRFFFKVTLGRPDLVERTAFVREPRKLPVVLNPEEVVRLREVLTPYWGRWPHHARKDRIGTWEIPRLTGSGAALVRIGKARSRSR